MKRISSVFVWSLIGAAILLQFPSVFQFSRCALSDLNNTEEFVYWEGYLNDNNIPQFTYAHPKCWAAVSYGEGGFRGHPNIRSRLRDPITNTGRAYFYWVSLSDDTADKNNLSEHLNSAMTFAGFEILENNMPISDIQFGKNEYQAQLRRVKYNALPDSIDDASIVGIEVDDGIIIIFILEDSKDERVTPLYDVINGSFEILSTQ